MIIILVKIVKAIGFERAFLVDRIKNGRQKMAGSMGWLE
jgi:hypothetical protein